MNDAAALQAWREKLRTLNLDFLVDDVTRAVRQEVQEYLSTVAQTVQAPSVLFRPTLTHVAGNTMPGNETVAFWIAEYGGFSATGKTPAQAMESFDGAWTTGVIE